MTTSIELLAELTSTDLVVIKDGVDITADSLSELIKLYQDDELAKNLVSAYYAKTDLSNRLALIIETKIAEDYASHKTPF